MTIVGDIAQATSAHAPASWKEVLAHLPKKNPSRIIGLTVGYRIPHQIMELATRVLKVAAPSQTSPVSVREGEETPKIIATTTRGLFEELITETKRMTAELSSGNVAIVCPDAMSEDISVALDAAQIAHGRAGVSGIEAGLTVVPVSVVKGLELDGVIVVEPAKIVAAQMHGLRALYVALTRSTKQLSVIHSEPLPSAMLDKTN
jgi:DNA helicase IV